MFEITSLRWHNSGQPIIPKLSLYKEVTLLSRNFRMVDLRWEQFLGRSIISIKKKRKSCFAIGTGHMRMEIFIPVYFFATSLIITFNI